MAGLADWLEDYRNWRGRQEWEQGKGWQDFFGGDPRAQEQFEKLSGFGTDAGGLVGMIKASHGSPHAFTKFDMSKIGTGEGAQAYGHGGYFAQGFDSPVAKSYKGAGSTAPDPSKDIVGWSRWMMGTGIDESDIASLLKNGGKTNDETAQIINDAKKDVGNLYNVELRWPDAAREAADPLGEHHLLDWDARLSEQPEYVRKAFEKADAKRGLLRNYSKILDPEDKWTRGGDAYSDLALALNDSVIKRGSTAIDDSHKVVSNYLRDLGIPGIRYLDQASRGAGEGTRNYVMFDDALASIVSRNGVSLSDLARKELPYQIEHKPMQIEGGAAPLHDLLQAFGDEIYGNPRIAEQLWGSGLKGEKEMIGLMQKLRGKPEELVDIYRGVPEGVTDINPGDWVTLHPRYAEEYGNVISKKVPAKYITSWPDSLVEFGYYPK